MSTPNCTCLICGQAFYRAAWQLKRNGGKYCSYTCRNRGLAQKPRSEEWRTKQTQSKLTSPKWGHKIEMVCDGCGVHFWQYASQRPKPLKFCTRACCLAYQRNKVPTADLDSAAPPKKAEPGMNVVYDPARQELRNE